MRRDIDHEGIMSDKDITTVVQFSGQTVHDHHAPKMVMHHHTQVLRSKKGNFEKNFCSESLLTLDNCVFCRRNQITI